VDAHRLPRQRGGDGARRARDRRHRRRLRQLHPVRRVRAPVPQHAVHRRLLPLPHPHGRRGQGGAALAVDSGVHQPSWQSWNERTDLRTHEPVLGETRSTRSRCATGPTGLDIPVGGETSCSSTARRPTTGPPSRGRSRRCCSWPATSSAS
jgi:hypothetical protein